MKTKILLFSIFIAGLSSCSSSYKTTQTPDDVYYSPVRLHTDDVRRDNKENTQTDNNVYTNTDDRNLRVRVRNRRYRTYDRYDERYNYPYGYNYPVYTNPVYTNPKTSTPVNTPAPRKYNLGVYKKDNTAPAVDPTTGKQPMNNSGNTNTNVPVRNFGNSSSNSTTPAPVNNGSAVGNLIRKVFSGNNSSNDNTRYSNDNSNNSSRNFDTRTTTTNTNNNSNNSNTPTNNSSNSSSGSSSSGSSGSVPVRVIK